MTQESVDQIVRIYERTPGNTPVVRIVFPKGYRQGSFAKYGERDLDSISADENFQNIRAVCLDMRDILHVSSDMFHAPDHMLSKADTSIHIVRNNGEHAHLSEALQNFAKYHPTLQECYAAIDAKGLKTEASSE